MFWFHDFHFLCVNLGILKREVPEMEQFYIGDLQSKYF